MPMATWSKHELRKIAQADDLHIAPFRDDGVTYGTPTWIWSVAVDSQDHAARDLGLTVGLRHAFEFGYPRQPTFCPDLSSRPAKRFLFT